MEHARDEWLFSRQLLLCVPDKCGKADELSDRFLLECGLLQFGGVYQFKCVVKNGSPFFE